MIKVNVCQCSSRLKKFVKKVEPVRVRFKRLYKKSAFLRMNFALERFFEKMSGNGLYYKARVVPYGDFRWSTEKTGWRL